MSRTLIRIASNPTSRSKAERMRTLQRELKSLGITGKPGDTEVKVLGRAVKMINKQLNILGVGLYRRENLLRLRKEYLGRIAGSPRVHIVSGGLPGLGKRR